MKSLFITLLIIGGAIAAYDYFGSPPGEKFIFTSLNKEAPKAPPSATAPPSDAPKADTEVAPVASSPAPVAPPPAAAPVAAAAPSAPPAPMAPAAPKAEASGFVPPSYDPIEKLTENWTKIPPSAFPRDVTLLKATLFKMSVGGSTIAAGAKAVALSLQGSQLMLEPTASSAARAIVPVDDTDFKQVLLAGYEKWKVLRTDSMRKAYERKLAAKNNPAPVAAAAPTGSVDPTGKPVQSPDGAYPLLVAHLKSGEVTEVKAENIRSWSDAVSTNHEGKPAWVVKATADVNTIFGLQPVEVMAVVRDNRVVGWYYTGSGEPVP